MKFTKLNVGSRDEIKPEPWLNIDLEPLKPRSNYIQMDVFAMPKEWDNQFEEVIAVHVLEHINRNLRQDFVNALYRVTKPGGVICIEVPDFLEVCRKLVKAFETGDKEAEHRWTTSIYGKQRSPGDQHCWGFNLWTLTGLCQNAGFITKDVIPSSVFDIPGCKYSPKDLISSHYKQEPILLYKGFKPT